MVLWWAIKRKPRISVFVSDLVLLPLAKLSMFNLNSISVTLPGSEGLERIGTALFLTSSFLNHSCIPNLDVSFSSGDNPIDIISPQSENSKAVTLHAVANRDISNGEQLFLSYVDAEVEPYDKLEERRRYLKAAYGFECRCRKCVEQEAKSGVGKSAM